MRMYLKGMPKFQEGGVMPQEAPQGALEGAPQGAPEGAPEGGDPIMQLAQMAAQALQNQDCQAAMQVCQVFMQIIQSQGGGGGAEQAPTSPEEGTPEEMGEPVYRRGGILVKRIK